MTDIPANSASVAPQEGGILASEQSLRDIAAAVGRRQWIVALVFLATVGIGTWRTMTEQRVYASAVTVRVERNDNPIANAQVQGPQYDFRVDPLVSEQQVIKSQTVAERAAMVAGMQVDVVRPPHVLLSTILGDQTPVVRQELEPGDYTLHLDEARYSLSQGAKQYPSVHYGDTLDIGPMALSVPQRPAIRASDVSLRVEPLSSVARDLRANITTRVLPQTDIVEISVTGGDPVRVRTVANTVANVYAEYAREGAQTRALKRSQFIAQSLEEQARALKRSQDSLRDFQERNRTSDVTDEQTELFKRIDKLQADRAELVLEQQVYLALVGRLAQADTTDEELRKLVATDAVEHNKSVADLYASWFELSRTRQRLSLSRDDRNVDIQALDSSIAATKRNLQFASKLYLQGLATRSASITAA